MATTIAIEGLDGLRRALRAVPKIARKELATMLIHSTSAIYVRALANAPRDRGDLIDAIGETGAGLRRRVGIKREAITGRGGSRAHQDPAIYAVYQERGTAKQSPRPFMRPAADEETARFPGRVRGVAQFLELRAARAGGKG